MPNMGVFQGPRHSSGFQSWQESMSLAPEQSLFPPPFFLLIRPQCWSWTLPRKEGKEVSIYQLQTTDLPQLLIQWQAEQNQFPRESGLPEQAGRMRVDWRRGPLSSLAPLPWVWELLALPLSYGATTWWMCRFWAFSRRRTEAKEWSSFLWTMIAPPNDSQMQAGPPGDLTCGYQWEPPPWT